jgi:signal transduction histidine kinase
MDSISVVDEIASADDELAFERALAQRTSVLQERVQGLERFCAQVAHDLRDVLGGIAGLAEIAHDALVERRDDGSALRSLPLIAQQAHRSAQMLRGLLRLAQTREAPLRIEPVQIAELAPLVAQEVALCHGLPRPPALRVQALPLVAVDPDLLHAVLHNLINNAVKFTRGRDDACIHIDGAEAGGELTVCVRDNGIGFDRACAGTLFQPLVRLHGPRYEGCGIGLSIVRSAVERHGGRVWADAAPGEGARFYFTLPLHGG